MFPLVIKLFFPIMYILPFYYFDGLLTLSCTLYVFYACHLHFAGSVWWCWCDESGREAKRGSEERETAATEGGEVEQSTDRDLGWVWGPTMQQVSTDTHNAMGGVQTPTMQQFTVLFNTSHDCFFMIHTIILCTQHPAKLVYIIGILVFILRTAASGANIEVVCASFGEYEHDIKVKLNNKCSQPHGRSELKGDLK